MNALVSDEVADLGEGAVAKLAGVRFALLVDSPVMLLQGGKLDEGLEADGTLVRALTCVRTAMLLQRLLAVEKLQAVGDLALELRRRRPHRLLALQARSRFK